MKQRIITALILAPLVILGIFYLPLPAFMVVFGAISLIGVWEWTQFVEFKSRIRNFILFAIIIACGGGAYFYALSNAGTTDTQNLMQLTVIGVGVGWWLFASCLAITYPKSAHLWDNSKLLSFLFGLLTLVPFFYSIVLLRAEQISDDFFHGSLLVLYVCLIVWTADSAAYFAGRQFGKRKMAPEVSPNKTIEGLMGGIIASFIVGFVFAELFNIHFTNLITMFITIFFTVVISVLGDLVESMFKRASGIKDSSHIIPGHGGVLDRIDSLTAAFPVFALLYFIL